MPCGDGHAEDDPRPQADHRRGRQTGDRLEPASGHLLRHRGERGHGRPHEFAAHGRVPQGVMEFLLINHPLDCPICDQAGGVPPSGIFPGIWPGRVPFHRGKGQKAEACGHWALHRARRRALHHVFALHPLHAGNREGRRPRIREPRQLYYAHRLSRARTRQQLFAQYRRHLPRRRAHVQGFPLQDARLVPSGNQDHRRELRHGHEHPRWQPRGDRQAHHPCARTIS